MSPDGLQWRQGDDVAGQVLVDTRHFVYLDVDDRLHQDLAGHVSLRSLAEFEDGAEKAPLPARRIARRRPSSCTRQAGVHDIRHTRLTKWLNDGTPPAQVAD
ncbi:hypothetical protein [Streptomyces bauhiniae]|uniref:hypothetical protein n=1 Tax=Streptomyces bauhiniae TaxID=2340725 RepID=UPI003664111B